MFGIMHLVGFLAFLQLSGAFAGFIYPGDTLTDESGVVYVASPIKFSERAYYERDVGCDIECLQYAAGRVTDSAMLQLLTLCGCEDLLTPLPAPVSDANSVGLWPILLLIASLAAGVFFSLRVLISATISSRSDYVKLH